MKSLGILFDLDGTLVYSLPDLTHVVNHVRAEYGISLLSEQVVRKNVGKGMEHFIRGAFADAPPDRLAEISNRYREYYLEKPCSSGHLYPGVRATLDVLRQKPWVKLGVVTNKPSLMADKTIAYYLPGFKFDVVAGPERVSAHKPSPLHILDVLPGLHLLPTQVWYIGDDPVDAEAARGAGVQFLGAGFGYGGVQVEPSQMLASFPELLQKIPLD